MQKQTHDKIHKIENQINRLEKIVLVGGMGIMGYDFYVIIKHSIKNYAAIAKFFSSRAYQIRHSYT